MKTMIQQSVIATLLLVLVTATSRKAEAVAVPSTFDLRSEKQTASKSDVTEDRKNVDIRLQQIVEEMTLEQKRHQERLENIKKELQQLKTAQSKPWMPAKIAMVLGQDSE